MTHTGELLVNILQATCYTLTDDVSLCGHRGSCVPVFSIRTWLTSFRNYPFLKDYVDLLIFVELN